MTALTDVHLTRPDARAVADLRQQVAEEQRAGLLLEEHV